jgi:D-amino-acid dehydrogenase
MVSNPSGGSASPRPAGSGAPRRVAIVGAGVIGLCCAHSLNKRGIDVVVLEKDTVGAGCSLGNCGWICPLDCAPLPEPGLTAVALRSFSDHDSALHLKPGKLPSLAPWLLRFWLHCNDRHFQHGLEALALLGRPTFDLMESLLADGIEFELHRDGMVYATRDESSARAALDGLQAMRRYGYKVPDQVLVGSDLHELEPSLGPTINAGFLVEEHWHVRPDSFTHGLADSLRARGVEIREHAGVTDFITHGGEIRAVHTDTGRTEVDAVVLAAGAVTQRLAAGLGVKFPMQAGKGYSFTVRPKETPRHALAFPELHLGCSPYGDALRVAGTMELSGLNTYLDRRRVEAMVRAAREGLCEWKTPEAEGVWAGMRPITPDGLPVLDRANRPRNLFVATGHSMQGVYLSTASGEQMAEFVASGKRPQILEPFRLDRFSRLRTRLAPANEEERSQWVRSD